MNQRTVFSAFILAVPWYVMMTSPAMAQDTLSGPAVSVESVDGGAVGSENRVAGREGTDDASEQVIPTTRLAVTVVTSQRREENIQDVPVAITALGDNVLATDETIKTANDVTQYIPNAQAPATDGRTRPRWFLRGIGTNETAATTVSPIGIYHDEVYLNNVYIQGFPLFDTERVEVLRGPQGTLWGKNTTGGAIHYISRRPTFDTEGYARVGVGSFNERVVQGAVGGELVADKVAARVSFFDEQRDGWVDNVATGEKDGAARDSAVRAQLLWQATDNLEALFSARTRSLNADKSPSFYDRDPPGGAIANPLREGALSRKRVSATGRAEDILSYEGASVRLNWDLGGYTLTSISSYDTVDRVLFNNSPYAVQINRSRAETDSSQVNQEIRLTSPREDRLNWILGAFFFKEDLRYSNTTRRDAVPGMGVNPANPSPFGFDITDVEQETTSYALFGSTTYNFTDDWAVTVGLRQSREEKDYKTRYWNAATGATFNDNYDRWWEHGAISALNPVSRQQDDGRWNELTYDVTPQWRISPNVNAYVKYSRGFRAGGFVEAAGQITKLDPEKLDAYEIGLKTHWLDGRLTVNSAVFNYDYTDIIVGVLLPVPGTSDTRQVQENAASGYSRGIEIEALYAPVRNFRIGGSVGVLKTKYEDYSSSASGVSIDADGNHFTRAPELSLTLFTEYAHPLQSGAEVGVGTDWSWRDKQYYNAVNQTNPLLRQDAYALGNARLFYRAADGRFETTAYVRNVTDEIYSVLSTGPSQGRTRQVLGLPRSFGISAQWNFF